MIEAVLNTVAAAVPVAVAAAYLLALALGAFHLTSRR